VAFASPSVSPVPFRRLYPSSHLRWRLLASQLFGNDEWLLGDFPQQQTDRRCRDAHRPPASATRTSRKASPSNIRCKNKPHRRLHDHICNVQ
jgi:hypothetical protein